MIELKTSVFAAVPLLGAWTCTLAGPKDIALASGCQVCHAANTTMLGPSYQAMADKYRGEEGAADRVFAALRKGASGVWGQVPMMAVDPGAVSDEDLKAVIRWILEHRDGAPPAD